MASLPTKIGKRDSIAQAPAISASELEHKHHFSMAVAMLDGALRAREDDGTPAGADILRAFVQRALEHLKSTGHESTPEVPKEIATEVAAVAASARDKRRTYSKYRLPPQCRFMSACPDVDCTKVHPVQGVHKVITLTEHNLLSWCSGHRRWHADDRKHLCMMGKWIIEPTLGLVKGLKVAGYHPRVLRELHVPVEAMKAGGYSANELCKAGYAWSEVKSIFTAGELKEEGFSLQQLLQGGFDAFSLHQAGFAKNLLLAAGVAEWELSTKPKGFHR